MTFRLGILSFLFVVVLDVVVAWGLYVSFAPVNRHLSLLAAWFRVVYAAVFAVAILDLGHALRYLTDTGYLAVIGADQLQAQALLSVNAFVDGWSIAYVLFGLHLIFAGYLVFKTNYIPQAVGRPGDHCRTRLPVRVRCGFPLPRLQRTHQPVHVLGRTAIRHLACDQRCERQAVAKTGACICLDYPIPKG